MMMNSIKRSQSSQKGVCDMATSINDLVKVFNETFTQYANGIGEEAEKLAEKYAKEAVQQLKATSPKRDGKNGGKYAKGWRAKKVNNAWVVHNATRYRLTHLLEKGHAKVNGGRTKAIKHIEPVEEEVCTNFVNSVEEVIRG